MQFYALIDKVVTFTLDLVTSKVCPLELFELYKLKGIQEDYGAVTYVAKANIEHLLALHFEFMEKKEREFMNNNWIKAYNNDRGAVGNYHCAIYLHFTRRCRQAFLQNLD